MKKYKYIVLNITISLGIGVLSSLLTMNSMDLYNKINTPKIAPSSIVFPIVWTLLYILIGLASYLIPVSYTHLDVYKRQILNPINYLSFYPIVTLSILLFKDKKTAFYP